MIYTVGKLDYAKPGKGPGTADTDKFVMRGNRG
jgi:hypothetical protein